MSTPIVRCCCAIAALVVIAVLHAQPRGQSIMGKVTFGPSKPATHLWVMLYDDTGEKARTVTGDDGRYYMGRLVAQPYTIIVRRTINGKELYKDRVRVPTPKDYNIPLK